VNIIFSNQYYIRMASDKTVSLLADNLTNSVALDYDWEDACIYWSDVTAFGSSIKRRCSMGKNSSVINKDTFSAEQV